MCVCVGMLYFDRENSDFINTKQKNKKQTCEKKIEINETDVEHQNSVR